MRGIFFAMSVACLLGCPELGLSAEPKPNENEQAVRAAIDSYVKAFNAADADAVAEHWANDAKYTLPSGEQVTGRAAIRDVFAKLFAESKPPKIDLVDAKIRFIAKGVALEEGTVRVLNAELPPEDSNYMAVHVKQGKAWKLTSVHETVLPTEPASANQNPLQELAWLVGDWEEQTANGKVESHFQWTKNHTFITCQFKVPLSPEETLEGTQVIGWDPEQGTIRSWLFDSAGGIGAGVWTRTNNLWSVKFEQVLPDGRRAASTNIYEQLDDNTFKWKTIGRKIDGVFAKNMGPFKAVRVVATESNTTADQPAAK